jgi:hypothetical protein
MLGGPPTRSSPAKLNCLGLRLRQGLDRLAVGDAAGDDVSAKTSLIDCWPGLGPSVVRVASRAPFQLGSGPPTEALAVAVAASRPAATKPRPPRLTLERGRSGTATVDRGQAPRRRVLSVVRLDERERISARTADMPRILRRRRHGLVEEPVKQATASDAAIHIDLVTLPSPLASVFPTMGRTLGKRGTSDNCCVQQ